MLKWFSTLWTLQFFHFWILCESDDVAKPIIVPSPKVCQEFAPSDHFISSIFLNIVVIPVFSYIYVFLSVQFCTLDKTNKIKIFPSFKNYCMINSIALCNCKSQISNIPDKNGGLNTFFEYSIKLTGHLLLNN